MTRTKPVAQLDQDGYFVCPAFADESPLEPGHFLLPGGCVDATPLPPMAGKCQRFVGGIFIYEDLPLPPVSVDEATQTITPITLTQEQLAQLTSAVVAALRAQLP